MIIIKLFNIWFSALFDPRYNPVLYIQDVVNFPYAWYLLRIRKLTTRQMSLTRAQAIFRFYPDIAEAEGAAVGPYRSRRRS